MLAATSTVRSRRATAAVISTVYNSIKQIEHACCTGSGNVGISQLCSSRGLSSQLLLVATPTMLQVKDGNSGHFSASSSSNSATTQLQATDPVLEWLHILFFYLLKSRSSNLYRMFLTLRPRAQGESVWDFDMPALEKIIPVGRSE